MSKIKNFFAITMLSFALFGIGLVYAAPGLPATTPNPGGSLPATGANQTSQASLPATGAAPSQAISVKIDNPLGVKTINEAIAKIMNVIVKLAIPVIICFFIWTGFQFILAQGDSKKLGEAKGMLGNVIIGSILILGAWTIATAIVNTVNLITTGTTN